MAKQGFERFSSREEIPWAEGSYDDGYEARVLRCGIDQAPSASVIGEFAHRSWIAGWADADMHFLAEEIEKYEQAEILSPEERSNA